MYKRPSPGSREEKIFQRLLSKVRIQKKRVAEEDEMECARLAKAMEELGRFNPMVKALAEGLGLDPRWLPDPWY